MKTIAGQLQNKVFVDELTYRSYRVQRDLFPEIEAGRWAQIFDHQSEMEARYQREILEKE